MNSQADVGLRSTRCERIERAFERNHEHLEYGQTNQQPRFPANVRVLKTRVSGYALVRMES
jgi:hypothetical protein